MSPRDKEIPSFDTTVWNRLRSLFEEGHVKSVHLDRGKAHHEDHSVTVVMSEQFKATGSGMTYYSALNDALNQLRHNAVSERADAQKLISQADDIIERLTTVGVTDDEPPF